MEVEYLEVEVPGYSVDSVDSVDSVVPGYVEEPLLPGWVYLEVEYSEVEVPGYSVDSVKSV